MAPPVFKNACHISVRNRGVRPLQEQQPKRPWPLAEEGAIEDALVLCCGDLPGITLSHFRFE